MALIVDIGRALAAQGVAALAIANAHFDPANLGSIRQAVEILRQEPTLRVVFPDVTRRPWAERLTEEFKSGACHAGRYEGSVVLALRPDLVDDELRRGLPVNPISLSVAIKAGKQSFEEVGGTDAYFGDPAAATAEEGRRTIAVLGGHPRRGGDRGPGGCDGLVRSTPERTPRLRPDRARRGGESRFEKIGSLPRAAQRASEPVHLSTR